MHVEMIALDFFFFNTRNRFSNTITVTSFTLTRDSTIYRIMLVSFQGKYIHAYAQHRKKSDFLEFSTSIIYLVN